MMKRILTFTLTLAVVLSGSTLFAQGEMPNKTTPKPTETGTRTPPKIQTNGVPIYFPRTRPVNNFPTGTTASNTKPAATYEEKMLANKYKTLSKIGLLSPEVQEVEILQAHKAFTIKGTKGFEINFPEYAFVDKEGNIVTGEVKVELTEYTSNSDFAGAGLTSQTTEGMMLETGGMINIDVLSGKEKVKLANGKSIEIKIATVKKGEGFREFYGVGAEQTTWTLTPPPQGTASFDTSKLNGYTIVLSNTKQRNKGEEISFPFFSNTSNLIVYVNSKLKVTGDVKAAIKKSGIPFEYVIELNSNGKIKKAAPADPELATRSLIAPLNEQIISILTNAPALAMGDGNLYANTPYTLLFVTTGSANANLRIRKSNLTDSTGEPITTEAPVNANDKTISEDFTMNSQGLSKINCDRFATVPGPKDTVAFNFNRSDAFVYAVFKDMNSFMMPSGANGKYVLRNVPEGQKVRYVAVVFNDKGDVQLGSVDTEISNSKIEFKDLQKYDQAVFKKMLDEK